MEFVLHSFLHFSILLRNFSVRPAVFCTKQELQDFLTVFEVIKNSHEVLQWWSMRQCILDH